MAFWTLVIAELGEIDVMLWQALLVAFLTGISVGWLFWGGEKEQELTAADRVRAKAEMAVSKEVISDDIFDPEDNGHLLVAGEAKNLDHSQIEKLAAELAAARQEMDARVDDNERFAEDLTALDSAISRANGRLKQLIGLVEKGMSA